MTKLEHNGTGDSGWLKLEIEPEKNRNDEIRQILGSTKYNSRACVLSLYETGMGETRGGGRGGSRSGGGALERSN